MLAMKDSVEQISMEQIPAPELPHEYLNSVLKG